MFSRNLIRSIAIGTAAVAGVLKFNDGSYAVKYIKISWPHQVFVSKTFKVTGAIG